MDSVQIFYWVYAFNFVAFAWNLWLLYRQYRVHFNTDRRPSRYAEIISEEDYDKARLYKLDKHRLGFFKLIFEQIQVSLIFWFNVVPFLWCVAGNLTGKYYGDSEIVQSVVFCFIQHAVDTAVFIPFGCYDTFVIETKFGFNKQKLGAYLLDRLKKFILSVILGAPVIAIVIWIIKFGSPYSFVYVWLFLSVLIFAVLIIYPDFIAPLFDKYVPLPDSELKVKIEALADRLSFPMKEIFVYDSSEKSGHSNAFMYGFGKCKRIVLYDTLLSKEMNEKLKESYGTTPVIKEETEDEKSKSHGMSDDEVVAVMAHEFGHWQYVHFASYVIIGNLNLLLFLVVFSYFYQNAAIYKAFGFDTQPVLIGAFLALRYMLPLYYEFLWFAMSYLSRWKERCADRFAAEVGYASTLSSALIKLGQTNSSLPVDDWLYSMARYSHPPFPERVLALKKYV